MDQRKRGNLKIFFSYAESIGKTQAMLKAAEIARKQGIDVVVGYIAAHTSEQVAALSAQLERLAPAGSNTFDLDLALARKPELLLIDELAYTNASGHRHKMRHQEVYELLNAGINVYTTVNVGNIESLHDVVEPITGITTWDRIPDYVFDNADQVELIDIEPQELIGRLSENDTAESQLTVEQLPPCGRSPSDAALTG